MVDRTPWGIIGWERSISTETWPELSWPDWRNTAETLHLWMQIVGKVRLALATPVNHWWQVAFYPTCRGLTTSPMPYGERFLQIDFDFMTHQLILQTHDGLWESVSLASQSVADFYTRIMERLNRLNMPLDIRTLPTEMADPVPFEQDNQRRDYDAHYANRFWRILLQTDRVFQQFRSRFTGKVSPTHFFWGGFDLALTRFSGRTAPLHASVPNTPDRVVQTSYSHEVSSCGFWPGGPLLPEPVFYSYAYPSPPGFAEASVSPPEAYFHSDLGEFVLPYDTVRQAEHPDQTLLAFLQSTYEAAANRAQWDRAALESASITGPA